VGAPGNGAPIFSVEVRYDTVVVRFKAQRERRWTGQSEKWKVGVVGKQKNRRIFQFPSPAQLNSLVHRAHVPDRVIERFTQIRGLDVALVRGQLQCAAQLSHDVKVQKLDERVRQRLVVDRLERIRTCNIDLFRAGWILVRATGQQRGSDKHVFTQAASPPGS
jgi:hypothetical protein